MQKGKESGKKDVNVSMKVVNEVENNDTKELLEVIEKVGEGIGQSNIIASQGISESILEASIDVSRSISEITRSNYSIAKSIKQNGLIIFKGLEKISDEIERNNKINEYYMLQKEIEEYEDWLVEKGLLKEFYDNTKIEETEKLQISQKDIEFATSIFKGEEVHSIIQLIMEGKEDIISYYVTNLIDKKLYLKNNQILVEDRVLINNYDSLGRVSGNDDSGTLNFLTGDIAIEIKTNIDDYFEPSAPKFLIKHGATIESYLNGVFEYMTQYLNCDPVSVRKMMEKDFKAYIVPSKKELRALLKNINCPDITKLADVQRIISSINMEKTLNDLRNLHEQLRLTIRNYKISVEL